MEEICPKVSVVRFFSHGAIANGGTTKRSTASRIRVVSARVRLGRAGSSVKVQRPRCPITPAAAAFSTGTISRFRTTTTTGRVEEVAQACVFTGIGIFCLAGILRTVSPLPTDLSIRRIR